MRINTSTQYAIKTLIYLAEANRTVPSSELSLHMSLSQRYLMQVVGKLREAGIVKAIKGIEGGYRLMCDPSEITLNHIIQLIEKPVRPMARAGDAQEFCKHRIWTPVYLMLQKCWNMILNEVTIGMMLHKKADEIEHDLSRVFQKKVRQISVD